MTARFTFSSAHVAAAIAATLVAYGSSAVIIFQTAQTFGSSAAQINSWFTALGLGCGLMTLYLSLRYKEPLMVAWSTPGAALMVGMSGIPLSEAVGAFLFAAALMLLVSASGFFGRLVAMIPRTLAAAMLAGILINFGSKVFVSMQSQTVLVGLMLLTYLLSKIRFPRYSILLMLVVGFVYAYAAGLLQTDNLVWKAPTLQWLSPEFKLGTLISVGIPLFIATLVTQNVPGIAVLRAYHYQAPVAPLINTTAIGTLLLAPFGGFMMNLAAISAAITMGPEVDPDPKKRYWANVWIGVFYLILAGLGGVVVSLFAALPSELLWALAGIAIFGTLLANLLAAWEDEVTREASLITLLTSASGMTLFGIGSAFWGLVFGVLVYHLNRYLARK
ncbi:benzoate membrane transport protein [Neisseria sp. HSC-16F19]|nr:benzoate/H(+) symporter BenE family transporter [Neisseria sp. HSC-16F19]MCP2041322.1 benzoate membrane transport protein [Neisseria sp. HSC-16F19]